MALLTHVRADADELVGVLCEHLASPLKDPFAVEKVAVPNPESGMKEWLTQRIASEMGVCANVEFLSLEQILREVMSDVPDLEKSVQAWKRRALVRSALAVLIESPDLPELIERYIRNREGESPLVNSRRLEAARKIAELFENYTLWRPAMIRSWREEGRELGPDGDPIPKIHDWQPKLWRIVRERIGVPSLAELLPEALEPIRNGSKEMCLPERFFVYGISDFAPLHMEVLEAAAAQCEVRLFMLHPSPALWEKTRKISLPPDSLGRPKRDEDPTEDSPRHPLLQTWAKKSREISLIFGGREADGPSAEPDDRSPRSLLARLQNDIRSNREPQRAPLDPDDRSIQIHVCYGDRRQVEVLRDAILHVLADNPDLQPRDVVIMTPDVAAFAPLVEALPERKDDFPELRVRVADRAPVDNSPLIQFASEVFDLASGRLEARTIRELIDMPVVRQRFGLDDETIDAVASLIEDSNIRWGLDADHRKSWKAGDNEQHAWRRGLDRILAGVFYSDSKVRVVSGVAPLDGVEGEELRRAGLLAQIIDRVTKVRSLLGQSRPFSEWREVIDKAVRLLVAPDGSKGESWTEMNERLEKSFPSLDPSNPDPEISPAEARLLIEEWLPLRPMPLRSDDPGKVTLASLSSLRSAPCRVVCLLGMDDKRFPRSGKEWGDDLLLDHELVGDPDPATEDRQLLLDAVLAAGDHLIVAYSGRDERSNAKYPPAVPIAELLETLEEMVGPEGKESIVTDHPLQLFSEKNFLPGDLASSRAWSFNERQLEGAQAVRRQAPKDMKKIFRSWEESAEIPDEISLKDLISFLKNPAQHFLYKRLGFRFPKSPEQIDDLVPTELDNLDKWKLTDRLLSGLLDGHSPEELEKYELATDALPPGRLAKEEMREAMDQARDLWEAARKKGHDTKESVPFSGEVEVSVSDKIIKITGTVTADTSKNRVYLITPSRLRGKQQLQVYVEVVFLRAIEPSQPWHGCLIGRHPEKEEIYILQVDEFPGERKKKAIDGLTHLVELYVDGIKRPIPMPCETSYIFARDNKWPSARERWEGSWGSPIPGEREDPAYKMFFPNLLRFRDLFYFESGAFKSRAHRLWKPILSRISEE